MKKTVIILLLATCFVAATHAQSSSISGSVTGLSTGVDKMVVAMVQGNKLIPTDTLTLDGKGRFRFETNHPKPALYLLSFIGIGKSVTHVMLVPGDKVSMEMEYDAAMNFVRVKKADGSRDAQLYQKFNELLYQFNSRAKAIDEEYALPSTSDSRKQELSLQFQQLQTDQNVAVRQLLTKNTDVLLSAFLVTYFDEDIETYYDLFEAIERALKDKYADNQFVQHVASKVKTSLGPGRMAPDIEMKDPDGRVRKLSDLKGSVVMIDFWASWCRPCRMENPNVVRLYHKYHDKGFDIYSVSLDKNRADWLRAIDQDGLVWPNHVSDLNGWTSSGGATYGITSVPNTVLVDRQGRIIARNLRGPDLERKLKEIFGE